MDLVLAIGCVLLGSSIGVGFCFYFDSIFPYAAIGGLASACLWLMTSPFLSYLKKIHNSLEEQNRTLKGEAEAEEDEEVEEDQDTE